MKYLHTMVRVTNLDASLSFYCDALGLKEISRKEFEKGRFTLGSVNHWRIAALESLKAPGKARGVRFGHSK